MQGLFLFLIGLVIIASMFRISFYYFIAYFLGFVVLLAWLWVRHLSRRITLRREFAGHAFQGEKVTIKLQLANRSRLPLPWLKVEDRLPQPLTTTDAFRSVVTLGPRLSRTVTYELVAKTRGYFPIGPAQLYFGDVFGFFERMLSTQTPHYLTVYPKIIPLADLDLPSRSPFGQFRTNEIIYEDPSRVAGVRDYLRGDSWRRINWRATATLGRLQVKKYEPAITLDTMLFLNLNPPSSRSTIWTRPPSWRSASPPRWRTTSPTGASRSGWCSTAGTAPCRSQRRSGRRSTSRSRLRTMKKRTTKKPP